ncbi:MAG: type IV pilus twitching motility protein PilT [Clostridia bacterium]|nr:type IV pilus twitching motility protein PilT [Deltaproteobacteria bacterium]
MVIRGLINQQQLEQVVKVQREYCAKQSAVQAAAAPAAPQSVPVVARVAGPPATAHNSSVANGSIAAYLKDAVGRGASDIHFHAGAAIRYRVHGQMHDFEPTPIQRERSETLVAAILNDEQKTVLRDKGQVDFSYVLPGVARFRGNAYRQQRGTDVVMRAISEAPPTLTQLGLPTSLAKLTSYHQGMVLLTGPAGSGKSSTMAALVNIINEERRDHIITIEDPIEYVHPPKRCSINQRQVGPHTNSFARALRAALREDPDVIALGELRDLETISLALSAAETGHLVLGTLHTNNAIRTINRLLGVYPPEQQPQIRTMLSESLRAVVSQRLIPRADGNGRVLALEILMVNKAVGNLVRENKTFQIRSAMQTGGSLGMVILDDSLRDLVKKGVITLEEAMKQTEEPAKLKG